MLESAEYRRRVLMLLEQLVLVQDLLIVRDCFFKQCVSRGTGPFGQLKLLQVSHRLVMIAYVLILILIHHVPLAIIEQFGLGGCRSLA